MRVAIHQPSYFPWLGYLDKMQSADVFVILDDVAANKQSFQYRNLFDCFGEAKWVTLPVDYRMGKRLNALRFKQSDWPLAHLEKLKNYYRRHPFFPEIYPRVEEWYSNNANHEPIDVLIHSIELITQLLSIQVNIIRSSSLRVDGVKDQLVFNICKCLGATSYISGVGAKSYMSETVLGLFASHQIGLEWQAFSHPEYSQPNSSIFVPGLSALDSLFCVGTEAACGLLSVSR